MKDDFVFIIIFSPSFFYFPTLIFFFVFFRGFWRFLTFLPIFLSLEQTGVFPVQTPSLLDRNVGYLIGEIENEVSNIFLVACVKGIITTKQSWTIFKLEGFYFFSLHSLFKFLLHFSLILKCRGYFSEGKFVREPICSIFLNTVEIHFIRSTKKTNLDGFKACDFRSTFLIMLDKNIMEFQFFLSFCDTSDSGIRKSVSK